MLEQKAGHLVQSSFTLTCVGSQRLQIECDEGHAFVFTIDPGDHRLMIAPEETRWKHNAMPDNSPQMLSDAARFASVCAEDFGLC